MRNALTIDVEDYFHVSAFRHSISPSAWDRYPLRVPDNTKRLLDWMEQAGVHATFFVLGWVAARVPGLVRQILERGHEVASHGFAHQLIYDIGPAAFREDLRRSRQAIEDAGGVRVCGFRAPSYSITRRSLWALDILIEEGFAYDSSIFPIRHDLYGIPGGHRFPHLIRRPAGLIREFPISTLRGRLGPLRPTIPVGGGGYLRLFPASFIRWAFQQINREGEPAVLYLHPWEIDPGQPRIRAGWKSSCRHYLNLGGTLGKLDYLGKHLTFAPLGEVLDDLDSRPAAGKPAPAIIQMAG